MTEQGEGARCSQDGCAAGGGRVRVAMARSLKGVTLAALTLGLGGCGAKPETKSGGEAGGATAPVVGAPAAATAPQEPQAPIVFESERGVSPRFAAAFGPWLAAAQAGGARLVLLATSEVSNAATALLEERRGAGGECRLHWLWIEAMDRDDGAGVGEVEARRFGGECCDAGPCARTLEGQHLRLLRAVAAKDWQAAAEHVAEDKAVAYVELTPEERSEAAWTRAQVASGAANIPSCGPFDTQPSCDEAAAADGSFTCRCDGGGYHVTYRYAPPATTTGVARLVEVEGQFD